MCKGWIHSVLDITLSVSGGWCGLFCISSTGKWFAEWIVCYPPFEQLGPQLHYVAFRNNRKLRLVVALFSRRWLVMTVLYLVGTNVNIVMYIFVFLECYNVYIILTENFFFILMLVHAENKELLFRPPCWCIVVTCQWCSVPSYIVCSQAHLWVMPASGKERVLKRSDQVGEVCWGRADCTCVPQTWACMQATSYIKPFLDL